MAQVRDARSLLSLKLRFLTRSNADLTPLIAVQREQFWLHAHSLTNAADRADGFVRGLLLWRLESTTAATRFTETLLDEPRSAVADELDGETTH